MLIDFLRTFFGIADLPVRFRSSYFPFTEPSMEVDIGWNRRTGELGRGGDWLEILGSGMVHPRVLANCGIDPREWQGFAWGMGVERIAMLKHGIPDLRPFFESDIRWLRHYGFNPLAPTMLHEGRVSHEVHPLLAEDPSRYRCDAGPDHRNADPHRPGTGGRGGSRRRPGPVPHRARDRGGAAPERRPTARVHDGHRQRHRPRGVRRAECAHRHEGRVRPAGTFIPGTGITLKVGEIRGVRSAGMLVSERELGLGEDHAGILDLPDDAPVGVPYAQWAGLDDPLIDVSVTPNRGDCFAVRGIARDLAAAASAR